MLTETNLPPHISNAPDTYGTLSWVHMPAWWSISVNALTCEHLTTMEALLTEDI